MQDKNNIGSMTPMQVAAIQLHELFMSLRGGGFTRMEALYLVSKVLTRSDESEPDSE